MLGSALQAAEASGEFLITNALVSDLERTRQTASNVFDCLGQTGRVISESSLLQERNFGKLRGQLYSELGGHATVFAPDYAPPDGETWKMFDERVAQAWQ